jgi:hypothetical protein
MIPAVGIIPVPLHLLRRYQDVFAVFPAPRKDLAVLVPDLGRIAVCAVAAAELRTVRHMPGRIKPFVQSLILRRMVSMGGTLSGLLRLGYRSEARKENARDEELARPVQRAASWIRTTEQRSSR